MILKSNATDILLKDYNPGKVIDRKEQKEYLEKYFLEPFLKTGVGASIYIYGPSGTGKTHTMKNFFNENMQLIKKYVPNFEFIFINGKETRTPYVTLVKIATNLEKYLPVYYNNKKINFIPIKGYDFGFILDLIKIIIEKERLYTIICIDEIDKIVKKDGDELIYNLLQLNNELNKGSLNPIFISNDVRLDENFSMAVKDRLVSKIHFSKYNLQSLYEILKEFAKLSLVEGSYDDKDLLKIAEYVANETGSARDAKQLLYFLALRSDEKLNISKIEEAVEEKRKKMYEKDIETLPLHQKFALIAVVDTWHNYIKKKEEYMMKGRGLSKYAIPFRPSITNIYNRYLAICKKYSEKPKSISSFRQNIKYLSRDGLIKTDVKSFGKAGGITTLCEPIVSIDVVEKLKKSLAWRLL